MKAASAGLLLFRRTNGLEVLLAHPGGPFWRNKDEGAWSIPKGLVNAREPELEAAIREFEEETGLQPEGPFLELGYVQQKAGKTIAAWGFEGDADPALLRSNSMRMEHPRGSGRWITVPEVDRCDWFDLRQARMKINPGQVPLLDRLEELIAGSRPT